MLGRPGRRHQRQPEGGARRVVPLDSAASMKRQKIYLLKGNNPIVLEAYLIKFALDGESFRVKFVAPLPDMTFYCVEGNRVATKPPIFEDDTPGVGLPEGADEWFVVA